MLNAHEDVFGEGLGAPKGTQAKIYVYPGATPKFVNARPVPCELKAKVEQELDCLQNDGIISPVGFSEWAAPIVPVVKQDGSVRICGDYKCTVNQVSSLDDYPIPKTEDLLATSGDGNKFTKLEMSQAYQQLLLDEESTKYTIINTHKGLYQYSRLPFEVSRVEAIKDAPKPKDVSQLRAFLGMLNYYHRFLPDVATVLEPLHKLLRKGSK